MKRKKSPDRSIKHKDIRMLEAFKRKKFIDAEMAGYIADKIIEIMPNLKEMVGKYDINVKDVIRFQSVSEKCRSEREKRGFAFKQIALSLKVPQYWLKYIESSSVKNINVDILKRYIDYLGLRRWFNLWKKNNLDVYARLSKEK
ncbi:MAG: hypothetical protein B1H08_03770 [Candidatus Omnitrophica bacterium 4484_171]|nr:MAG: hypothetical protein B1H08_03770 [Candidatus Omnitrophica bacterium 4484_171]